MSASPTSTPVLVISMGVSGCGKSTLARYLAKKFGFAFLEADDFHSAENKAHMASGKPLTDTMREPWITSMCTSLRERCERGESCVLAYSGLRRAHRARFRELGYPVLFVHLAGPQEVIRRRMEGRVNHFMPADLLTSQYAALEPALNEPDIIAVDVAQNIGQIQRQAEELVRGFIKQHTTDSTPWAPGL
jgi:gluconokinase